MGPLNGIRIIEIAGLGPGPFCGMMLADHGAEVIRVHRPGEESIIRDPANDFLLRSRKSIGIDLKAPDGVALVRSLCRSADAVFEGFRPGVMERLGLGPDVLLGDNPKLVYGRMTGFGQDGPYASMAGHDINYIALSGALHACGKAGDKPVPPLNLIGDFGGGGMMLAFGILAAILSERATGKGQVVDCAMTEGSALLMTLIHALRADSQWTDSRGVNLLDGGAPFYDSYEAADGKFVAIGSIEPEFYASLLALIGLDGDPEMVGQDDPARWPVQKAKIAAAFGAKTRNEWCAILENTDTCFAPVMSLDEAPHHLHNVARRAFVETDGIFQPAPAPRYSHTAADDPRPTVVGRGVVVPLLAEIGMSEAEIRHLFSTGVVS